jgi:hypothetical protein
MASPCRPLSAPAFRTQLVAVNQFGIALPVPVGADGMEPASFLLAHPGAGGSSSRIYGPDFYYLPRLWSQLVFQIAARQRLCWIYHRCADLYGLPLLDT